MTTIRLKPARSALQPARGFLAAFTHTLNPYSGCAFGAGDGCPFCYVRAMPHVRLRQEEWGSYVDVKDGLAGILRRELAWHQRRGDIGGIRVYLGSATDPFQGAEVKHGVTRSLLAVFADYPQPAVVLQTRSPLVLCCLDELGRIPRLIVNMTIETADEDARRRLTPTTAPAGARAAALAEIRGRGIFTQVTVSPVLPGDPATLADLCRGCADRVIVDTLWAGDGAGGRRSEELGMPSLLERWGYTRAQTLSQPVLDALLERFAPGDVLVGGEGFSDLDPIMDLHGGADPGQPSLF